MRKIEQRLQVIEELGKEELKIMAKKANDYSGTGDCNRNIRACDALGICSAEQGVLIRLQDKLSRLITLIINGVESQVDESIRDTIMDARNYLGILYDLRVENQNAATEAPSE